jgi:hypothetical protein
MKNEIVICQDLNEKEADALANTLRFATESNGFQTFSEYMATGSGQRFCICADFRTTSAKQRFFAVNYAQPFIDGYRNRGNEDGPKHKQND